MEVRYVPRSENGGRSSMVELQIVVLAVAGSSPVGHPIFVKPRGSTFDRRFLFPTEHSGK